MLTMTILQIFLKSLELTIEVIKNQPPESQKAAWDRHDRRMAFLEKVFDRLDFTREEEKVPNG